MKLLSSNLSEQLITLELKSLRKTGTVQNNNLHLKT